MCDSLTRADHTSCMLSYASPRTDRAFGRGFLDLPLPGRVVAEIAGAALLLSFYQQPEKFVWSFYLTLLVIFCLLVRPLFRRMRPKTASDHVDKAWWRLVRWTSLILLVLN